jgi:hypothetical protein
MKLTKRGIVVLVILPLVITGLFVGFLPLSLNVRSMNGASLLGVIFLAIAGKLTYAKVLQE